MNLFKKIQGPDMPRLRVVILSSPPWGVLEDEHDRALESAEIKVITLRLFVRTPQCVRLALSSNL